MYIGGGERKSLLFLILNQRYSPRSWCRTCVRKIPRSAPHCADRRYPRHERSACDRIRPWPEACHPRRAQGKSRSCDTRSTRAPGYFFADWTTRPCNCNRERNGHRLLNLAIDRGAFVFSSSSSFSSISSPNNPANFSKRHRQTIS